MGKKVHSVVKPLKKEKKPKRERPNTNAPGPTHFPIPTGHSKPFVKSPQHAKWPSMFKRHLTMIEAHIRTLDRVMMGMRANMNEMPVEEQEAWERGEKGMWATISAMMDRAKSCLVDARLAAVGILPSRALKEKKGLGVYGSTITNVNSLGANLEPLDNTAKDNSSGSDYSDISDSDEPEDSEDSGNEAEEPKETLSTSNIELQPNSGAYFTPLNIGKKRKLVIEGEVDETGDTVMSEEEGVNPGFVIDTEPTPVVIDAPSASKKPRKERREEENRLKREASKMRKEAKSDAKNKSKALMGEKSEEKSVKDAKPKDSEVVITGEPRIKDTAKVAEDIQAEDIDFISIQQALKEEVALGLKAEESKAERKEKKRKRLSDGASGLEIVLKKPKNENSDQGETEPKAKRDRKEKKRKAESEDGDEKKKKRKHRSVVET